MEVEVITREAIAALVEGCSLTEAEAAALTPKPRLMALNEIG
jgi:hypothetical protein